MICPPCRKQNHNDCIDNPRKLAFAAGELKGIFNVNAGEWCFCLHREPFVTMPVKAVSE